jgi:hypothetical protein
MQSNYRDVPILRAAVYTIFGMIRLYASQEIMPLEEVRKKILEDIDGFHDKKADTERAGEVREGTSSSC